MVICMNKFLGSFLRRRFAGETIGEVTKSRLFSLALLNRDIYWILITLNIKYYLVTKDYT